MLTKTQKQYLDNLDPRRAAQRVRIQPHRPSQIKLIVRRTTRRVQQVLPKAKIKPVGASALGISGQNDIDIYVLCPPRLRRSHLSKLRVAFGKPTKGDGKWKWTEHGCEVALNVVNPREKIRREKLLTFDILKSNPAVLKDYERLKSSMNGKTFRKYQEAKMHFLNEVVSNFRENERNLKLLTKEGAAVTNSHVVTPHGRHSTISFSKHKLYPHVRETHLIAKTIAKRFNGERIDAVIGLVNGGAILSEIVAYELQTAHRKPVLSFYIERDHRNVFALRDKSNRKLIKRKRVLIVDDTIGTGKTTKRVIAFVRRLGATVAGVGVIYSRNPLSAAALKIPKFYTFAMCADRKNSYAPRRCPLCRQRVPIDKNFGIGT